MKQRLDPSGQDIHDKIAAKDERWKDIIKIGPRTQYAGRDANNARPGMVGLCGTRSRTILERIEDALQGDLSPRTAVGTGTAPGLPGRGNEIAKLTDLPFISEQVHGARRPRRSGQLSGTLPHLSRITLQNRQRQHPPTDVVRPRAGFKELITSGERTGLLVMLGKVNPTAAEALTMIAVQVMANDVAVGFGGAGGYLEMNVYKPLMIYNITHSITILTDGCTNFAKFLVKGTKPNLKKIKEYVERSLMLVTALAPVIGYDKASKIAHHALEHDLTLKAAALQLGFVTEAEFDRVVDPAKMVTPYVATAQ